MKFHPNPRVIHARASGRRPERRGCQRQPRTQFANVAVPKARSTAHRAALPEDPWREIRLGGMVLIVIALLSALAG
jgi:hypothetical protein